MSNLGQGVFYYKYNRGSKEPSYSIESFKKYCKSWNMSVRGCDKSKGKIKLNLYAE